MKSKTKTRNGRKRRVRTRNAPVLPPAPWFLFLIRSVAVVLLLSLPVLLVYAFKIGAALGAWQVWAFLIYVVATVAVVCIGLGIPFRLWDRNGKRGLDITAGSR